MIPARETLRAAYDAVIQQIDSSRSSRQLTNAFYSKVGDAVFDACYRAVEHSEAAKAGVKTPKALKVVSGPHGRRQDHFHARVHHSACPARQTRSRRTTRLCVCSRAEDEGRRDVP